jgi:hypothetical protein
MKVTKNNEIYTACPKISSTFLGVFKTIRQRDFYTMSAHNLRNTEAITK